MCIGLMRCEFMSVCENISLAKLNLISSETIKKC